ncbi:hypothetical protein LUZ60_015510 [Juncus effusus]|nr:hypothetical protein LUZ60_015510 [Juncus effusus]
MASQTATRPPLPPRHLSETNNKIAPSVDSSSPDHNPLVHVIQFQKDHVIKDPPSENYQKLITYSRTRPSRRRILRLCHRILCASLCTAVLVLIVLAIIIYATFRPKPPSYSLTSLSISGFDPLLTSPTTPLAPYIKTTMHTQNPNKKLSILYQSGGTISVSFDEVELCNGNWPEFAQKPNNVTEFEADLNGSGILLTAPTRDAILKAENNSMVPLTMDANVPVKIKWGFIKSWSVTVKVSCDVKVNALSPKATVLSKKCSANTHYLW